MKKSKEQQQTWQDVFRSDLVKQIMVSNGWTDRVLSERMGIDVAAMNKIKNMKVDFRMSSLQKLAQALEVEPYMLLDPASVYARTATGSWRVERRASMPDTKRQTELW